MNWASDREGEMGRPLKLRLQFQSLVTVGDARQHVVRLSRLYPALSEQRALLRVVGGLRWHGA